jgi:hypothetical protein
MDITLLIVLENAIKENHLGNTVGNVLDININYQGRKTETSQTIHTGNIQLRAYF